ncbi:MAG: tRNA pseudouridine(55) synthase TruB [Ruminococcus sp.]|nr:tRNA pseudouridine(55) synthase TruB [Ruminococcus sp.]
MNGVLTVDKPEGFTSFDVIAVVRKLTGQRKTGHTGTLDPNATGVLPVLLGSATKAQDIIPNHDKTYEAEFRLGFTTDTLDIWGQQTATFSKTADAEQVEQALRPLRGDIMQVPPMYSAVKKDGKRLYDLARQGVEVERKARPVTVYRLTLDRFDEEQQTGSLTVSCSKGTYIRTLIDDMGSALGTGAVMTALRRTQACGFSVEDCLTLEQIRERAADGTLGDAVRSTESLFVCYCAVAVSDAQAKRFQNGGALALERTGLKNKTDIDKTVFRVKTRDGEFLGLGRADLSEGLLKIEKLFNTNT